MSKGLKITLLVGLALVLFIICSCCLAPGLLTEGVKRSVSEDPAVISKTTQSMLIYQSPPGYKQTAGDFWGMFKFVSFTSESKKGFVILLMQSPFINQSNMAGFQEGLSTENSSNSSGIQWRSAGTTQMYINGGFKDIAVSEGTDSSGVLYRSMTGVLDGRSGPVILMVRGRVDQWDQNGLYALLRSIKK